MAESSRASAVRVWDLPTRLFHWGLVGLFAFSWWSAENRAMDWHLISGVVLLGLLAFRLIWGFIGGSTARFATFLRSPARALSYLRGAGSHANTAGHNPLGGYSVIALLLLLIAQTATGLFATDVDGLDSGPLSFLISFDESRVAAEVHEVAFDALLVLVGLHLAAIVFYRVVRRRNLVVPMITGRDAQIASGTDGLVSAGAIRFIAAAVVAGAFAWAAYKGFYL